MDNRLDHIVNHIGEAYRHKIVKGGRHYLEVNIADLAEQMGYTDLIKKYRHAHAIVPLQHPESGMKVRIDGRTFVDYAEYPSGIAIPGYLARETTLAFKPYKALDSMVCNYS